MARFLRHEFNVARIERSGFGSCQKWLSSDALAEIGVNPGEVGLISGFPEEQLRRRVGKSIDGLDFHRGPICLCW